MARERVVRVEKSQSNQSAQGIKVIARAAAVLRALREDNNGLSLGQIADRIDLPRSTVQRIVNALMDEQFIMMTSAESGLRLGPEIQSLAAAGKIDVAEITHPVLVRLSEETGETCDLAVFKEAHMVFIDQVEGNHRLRTRSAIGEVFPLTDTANGKATLALLEDELAVSLVSQEMRNNEVEEMALSSVLAEIEEVRRQGYAFDIDGHTEGVSAVGAAFQGPNGNILALSIPIPSSRFEKKKDRVVRLLLEAVKEIESFF